MHFKMSFNNDLFINYSDYKYFCHNADRLNSYKFIHIQAFYIMYLSMILWIKPRALNKEEGILYEKLMVYIINVRKLKERRSKKNSQGNPDYKWYSNNYIPGTLIHISHYFLLCLPVSYWLLWFLISHEVYSFTSHHIPSQKTKLYLKPMLAKYPNTIMINKLPVHLIYNINAFSLTMEIYETKCVLPLKF